LASSSDCSCITGAGTAATARAHTVMGAACSQPAVLVELRLECLEVQSAETLETTVHTAAHGETQCIGWGKPQVIGLLTDDVITISMHARSSDDDLEEFAEVYVPWGVLSKHMAPGSMEVSLSLALNPGTAWLGQCATQSQYRTAFYRAYNMAKHNPLGPQLQLSVFMVGTGSRTNSTCQPLTVLPGYTDFNAKISECMASVESPQQLLHLAGSPASFCNTNNLTPDEVSRVAILQQQNQELHNELGLKDGDGPEVESQVQEHLAQLKQSVLENYELRAEMHEVDKALAVASIGLSEEQRGAVTGCSTPPQCSPRDNVEEVRHAAAATMREVQAITQRNIELIEEYDDQIKSLEMQLMSHRQKQQEEDMTAPIAGDATDSRLRVRAEELEGLEEESRRLEAALADQEHERQEAEAAEAGQSPEVQHLLLQHDVQQEQIGHLQALVERRRKEAAPKPPGSGMLQNQVGSLRAELEQKQHLSVQDQEVAEQKAANMRKETAEFEARLKEIAEEKAVLEQEVLELRRSHRSKSSIMREKDKEQMRKEATEKDLSRTRLRIDVSNEKITQLRAEADDIHQRASLLRGDNADAPTSDDNSEVSQLRRDVEQREEQLKELNSFEEKLEGEREEARRSLEAAKVQGAVLEQKMRVITIKMKCASAR